MKESDILYETKSGKYWILNAETAYEVYKTGLTHSLRCAIVGKSLGLERAIAECERREARHE